MNNLLIHVDFDEDGKIFVSKFIGDRKEIDKMWGDKDPDDYWGEPEEKSVDEVVKLLTTKE